jgi:hypothetical protein
MTMKPWYKVVTPREDLRSGKPLDASEFAVHLQHVRDGRAASVYQDPAEFFERTFFTKTLGGFAVQVLRRLSGIKVETSAVFDLSTQFGGGKTHSLTLAFHLARHGNAAKAWKGVDSLLAEAGITNVPQADTAVFVGTEFDSLLGRGGDNGEPHRRTPWGEIAFQLGGAEGLKLLAKHDLDGTSPGGDVIEKLLPTSRPTLILLDELMNYINRSRKSGLSGQFYTFLHNLSEVARARDNVVLAVSIPASELEMTVEDHEDFKRLKKLLDRLGKAIVMSAETETSEIIRRRLFEWGGLPKDATPTIDEYADWIVHNKQQLPSWFPAENAREELKACYPFHPSVLSVFERKWQGLPQFQQTRGVLRLLALWVSQAYTDEHQKALKDPLISLGSAPMENPMFRTAVFDQLGESRLEPAVTTDIAGKEHAHALRLDAEGTPEVKKARLHRKIATAVFFESNGGQQRGEATLPEVRMAVAEPNLNIGNVEQCLEALAESCYFLNAEKNKYRFSFQPNLNKLLADRRASVTPAATEERVRAEIQKVFSAGPGASLAKYFPRKSNEIPDVAALTIVVLAPDQAVNDPATRAAITSITTESGASSRTFKSALIWAVAEDSANLNAEARKLLAWKDISQESGELKLEEAQQRQLVENVKGAERDLREAVWRTYKNVFLLADDGTMRHLDLGLVHSSAAPTLVDVILTRLKQEDLVSDSVGANQLIRYWPPALPEWSTKSVRDAFYASPKFPRLLKMDAVKDTISKGLDHGLLAYVGKASDGTYKPFFYKKSLAAAEIELSDEVFIITKETAEAYLAKGASAVVTPPQPGGDAGPGGPPVGVPGGTPPPPGLTPPGPRPDHDTGPPPSAELVGLTWTGEVSPQKWMNFYTKVLSRFATAGGLKLTVIIDVEPPGGIASTKLEETRTALRELGLDEAGLRPKGKP